MTSGTHWDNVNGANITTQADLDVWDNYVKVRRFTSIFVSVLSYKYRLILL
jgi:hypothetical protein